MSAPPLRVAMIGYAFMGRAHAHAWRSVSSFFDVPLRPELAVVCGRNEHAVAAFAERWGWQSAETDWRRVVERDDVDLIDICTPGDSHAEIAIAALEAGKHVLCEKPLANSVQEAEAMVDAAAKAAATNGSRSMVAFNYRRVPALELARQLIASGVLGRLHHVRAVYLQDWIVDPDFPMVWRLRADQAGSGALGDIGSHIVDLAQHLTAQRVTTVSGLTETFVKDRPGGEVTVDDAALALARFDGGAIATFEATRFATGRKNGLRIEVNGSTGSVAFDLERLNELEVCDGPGGEGFRRVLVTEADHPWMSAWWPPGHVIGWEHTFTHEVKDLLDDIAAGRDPSPSFADGLQVQRVLDAVAASAASGTWHEIPPGAGS
jgi:predicted dehydrogenase